MFRYARIAVAVAVLAALGASSAYADPGSANTFGRIRGVVPPHALHRTSTSGNLAYNGGPVMLANNVYAIYWEPSTAYAGEQNPQVDSGYVSDINTYFDNVAAAGASAYQGFVYFTGTQYYEGPGTYNCSASSNCPVTNTSSLAGSVVDTRAFPANGCKDRYTKVCLSDSQIQTEINNVISAQNASGKGWGTGVGNLYLMFTPKGVGSCAGSSCAFSSYCAYHSWTTSTASSSLVYANMPYAQTVPSACGSGQSPNNDDADSTINVISHEHNESITDPLGSAWYAANGQEDGDKCAWDFGSSSQISGTSGSEYNQTINGAHYYLQQEWSNADTKCVLTGL